MPSDNDQHERRQRTTGERTGARRAAIKPHKRTSNPSGSQTSSGTSATSAQPKPQAQPQPKPQAQAQPKPQAQASRVTGWRCRICGYEYVGEELPEDFICPLCKHPASDFEKVVK